MLKPVEKPIKFIKNLSTKGKSYPITHVSAVIDDNGESVKSTIDSLKNKGSLTKVTWLELKNKRDAGKLIPGSLYRITDYQCTTTQENTQSANHQFDIVLLALSENKLAEEGWAMMHIDNIYKVVFDDNEVVSCYVTPMANHSNRYYVVNVDTLLGTDITITSDRIDEDNKIITLIGGWTPEVLADPDLPYNYFQNSNLSAWKVWYCLDNDTARFAWADDSVDGIDIGDWAYTRNSSEDTDTYYGWYNEVDGFVFTKSPNPKIGDAIYNADKEFTPLKVTRVGALVGRGVIYRLIDEWNNDVGYDFKNIQYVRPMTDGEYDDSTGTDTWVFTFSVYDVETQQYVDASIISGSRDENYMNYCWNNIISAFVSNQDNTGIFLPNNVFCQQMSLGDDLFAAIGDCYADGRSANNTIASSTMGIVLRRCDSNVISASGDLTIVGCYQQVIFDKDSTIILNGKAVLVET